MADPASEETKRIREAGRGKDGCVMGLFMEPECALLRLVEDDNAGLMLRVRALKQVPHPPLALLRRLLVDTPRKKPVPSKLRAIATMKYTQEMQLRKMRKQQKSQTTPRSRTNALGV